jgi:putative nucleotidyltransferase with HDIG domain
LSNGLWLEDAARVERPPAALEGSEFRLAELIAALSLATDLGNGFPMEKALRNCLLSVGICRVMGVKDRDLYDVYYLALLRFIACTSYAYEEATAFGGEDNSFRGDFAPLDHARPSEMLRAAATTLGRGTGPARRARAIGTFLTKGKDVVAGMVAANCEVAVRLAERLRMTTGVCVSLSQMHERWDGKGSPDHLSGEEITLPLRILLLAHVIEIFNRVHGREAALEVARSRAGGQLDPDVAKAFLAEAPSLLDQIDSGDVWGAVLDAEPEPRERIPLRRLDEIARAFADFVDLKSPYMLGHSSGVAALAGAAADTLGLADADVGALRLAALLHDLGRASVPNGIWDKRGPLSPAEWERVRLHPYYSERILSQSPALAGLASIAGMHHERLDSSGYHRAAPAALQSVSTRILGAADVFHALTEPRPHRMAFSPDAAARAIEAEVSAGRLDRAASEAVLEAAGQVMRRACSPRPAGLTDREIEVLRLLARGDSKKQIAARLFISPSTAHQHVAHIYAKVGISSRAAAALFAMENDLLGPPLDQK